MRRLGFDLPRRTRNPDLVQDGPFLLTFEKLQLEHALPCPEEFRRRFRELHSVPSEHRHVWTRNAEGAPDLVTTVWFDADATLGSANHEITWAQPHPVVGYWRSAADLAARLRVRVLLEGRDFAAGHLRCAQDGPVILAALDILAGEGTYHPWFDRPGERPYEVSDLRVRVEVHGRGVRVGRGAGNCWELLVGDRKVIVHPGPGWFEGMPVTRWEAGGTADAAWLDAILHSGAVRHFHPARMVGDTALAWGLCLAPAGQGPVDAPVSLQRREDDFTVEWKRPGCPVLALRLPVPPRRVA